MVPPYQGLEGHIPDRLTPTQRDMVPSYSSLQNTHVNNGYLDDEAEPKYQEIGATAKTVNPTPYANGGISGVGNVSGAYQGKHQGGADNYNRSPQPQTRQLRPSNSTYGNKSPGYMDGVKPITTEATVYPSAPPADRGQYPESQARYGDTKSPGAWSTKSAEMAPRIGFIYPEADNYGQPQHAYSERPSRDYQGGRSGYAEPRRLDFTNGPTKSQHGYQDQRSPRVRQRDNEQTPRGGGAYIDQSDTVV